jgi:hypothetical protein
MHRRCKIIGSGSLAALVFVGSVVACSETPCAASLPHELRTGIDSDQVVQEIDDPSTGSRWFLVRDAVHTGGPGRWVRDGNPLRRGTENRANAAKAFKSPAYGSTRFKPVLRAGDHLIVEEHSAVVDARLEAVALEPAATGSLLHVRLEIGGRVVRAVAVGPGRAVFQAQIGNRR